MRNRKLKFLKLKIKIKIEKRGLLPNKAEPLHIHSFDEAERYLPVFPISSANVYII